MILSNPMPGMLNRENKNQGPNPYAQQAAGLLQQLQAQQAMQQRILEEAAAKNQAEANKGGMNLSQFAQGMGKLLGKGTETPAQPLNWENAAPPLMDAPNPMMSDVPQTRYGMDDVGTMTPAEPSPKFSEMLPKLAAAAKTVYPDNPTMQQVALSQAILESGLNGRPSQLATKHNNYFGIKASRRFPGTGGTVDYGTTEYVGGSPTTMSQGFASNNSMDDSFRQHAALMSGASRYSPVLRAKSPVEAFGSLQEAGYATDPNYARKLRSIHQRYVSPYYSQ